MILRLKAKYICLLAAKEQEAFVSQEKVCLLLQNEVMQFLKLKKDMKLLSIRSSDIAFTMGAFGPLLEESYKHESEIKVY